MRCPSGTPNVQQSFVLKVVTAVWTPEAVEECSSGTNRRGDCEKEEVQSA
jgi:hypothetical protein